MIEPTDDDSSNAQHGGPSGTGSDGDGGGNFKRGRFKPGAILAGVAIVAAALVLAFFAFRSEKDTLSDAQGAKIRNELLMLPRAEQLPKWRALAERKGAPSLQQEAFAHLAWAKDAEGLELIRRGLTSHDHRVRGTAAQALLEYGTSAESARADLLKALSESDNSDRPQIAWALATLREASVFDTVLQEYQAGHLSKVQKLDESAAFDPEVIAMMVPLERLASFATSENESVRQLVATALSSSPDARWTDTLIALVQDASADVARQAAIGLGKIGNEKAMQPLLSALERADKDSRQRFLEALRDGVGAKGLMLALRSVQRTSADREKFQTKQIFDMLRELADPRGGDLLVAYIASNPHPHWKTEAAFRLAEVGDLRAVPTLSWRIGQDPLSLYNRADDPEYMQSDAERVVAARMVADLAIVYPSSRDSIRNDVQAPALAWATDRPQPHANALRVFAATQASTMLPQMRKWADPNVPLPKEGQQDFPMEWATAQSALRYLGWMKDPSSWSLLAKQLNRRPAKVDTTMESLHQGGIAVLGMTLRALGVGAADGFAQWGDPRAYPLLTKYIEEPMNNEQSRLQACFALAWVATDEHMNEVVAKVKAFNRLDAKQALIRKCYLETLVRRPVQAATAGLVELLNADVDMDVRHQAARAIGFGGVSEQVSQQLFTRLDDVNLRADAALALILGGEPDAAARAIASYNAANPEEIEELKTIYNQSFGYWSDKNYEDGDVARWIRNAEACARVRVHGVFQDWPRMVLGRAVQGIDVDNGPHSMTRVQLRARLLTDALSGDGERVDKAIAMLKFMREKGVLMALRSEPGAVGEAAREAFFEVMNPKAITDALPEPVTNADRKRVAPAAQP